MRNSWNRYLLLASAVLALSLAGCDPSQPAGAPEELPEQATAPVLPAPQPPPQAAPQAALAVPAPLTREEQRVRLLIEQVEHIKRGEFDDWHPPLMEWIWRQFLPIAHGPAPMLTLQLIFYAAGLGLLIAAALKEEIANRNR